MTAELPAAVLCAGSGSGERIDATQISGILVILCAIAAISLLYKQKQNMRQTRMEKRDA